jgi:hypothetical protein
VHNFSPHFFSQPCAQAVLVHPDWIVLPHVVLTCCSVIFVADASLTKKNIAAKIAANTVIIHISASPVRSTDPDKQDSFGRDCRRDDRHVGALVANEAQPRPFFGESRPEPRAKMGANCPETGQKPAGSHTAAEFFQTLFKYGTLQLPFRRGSPARGTS